MKIKRTTLFVIFGAILVIGAMVLISNLAVKGKVAGATETRVTGNIIEMKAKGGYFPSEIKAKAGVDAILRVTTKNTYDCSASFVVPQLKVDTMLEPNAVTDFKIPPQQPGSVITGACAMGMYGFKITFE